MDDKIILDSLIIGAGPIGLACGIEAKQRNLQVILLEKGTLVNSIYHYPANMTFFSTSEKIEIGYSPFVSHGPKPTRSEALEYYRRVAKFWDLDIRTYEEVVDFSPAILPDKTRGYKVNSTKGHYLARTVILATGFYDQPNPLHVPGEDLPKVKHYFNDPHPYIGQDVLVIGAANSAIDAALECWRKGARVTLVHRGKEISGRVKYWVWPDFENRVEEGSIKAYFSSKVTAIRPDQVDITTPEGPITLPNDWVLAMTGFQPNFAWMSKLGICFDPTPDRMPERNPDTFESNLPGVFLAGTVCGGMNTSKWFIENSIEHAHIIMEEIARRLKIPA